MEKHNKRIPIFMAIGIVIAVTIWMISGMGSAPASDGVTTLSGGNGSAEGLTQVRIQQMDARDITREILISGRTEPNREVRIKAETEGRVNGIEVERGSEVADGAPIISLAMRDREARLEEAEALLRQRELEYKGVENLRGQQFTSESQIAQANSQLVSARAARERIELEIDYTSIDAPFAGIVQDRMVEMGDFVRVGDDVVHLVDLDPIIVAGEVNERNIGHLGLGRKGSAILVDGGEVEGTVRYISKVADPATRTFTVELAVPNPDSGIRAGITAEMSLAANTVRVHTFSSALLSLADDGTVGVKVVDQQDRVQFYPIEIVGSAPNGVHVSGLPDSVRLITVGQGFVTEGQQVEPIEMRIPERGEN